MIRSRAEGRPRRTGRGPNGRSGAQNVQARISAMRRSKARSATGSLGSRHDWSTESLAWPAGMDLDTWQSMKPGEFLDAPRIDGLTVIRTLLDTAW